MPNNLDKVEKDMQKMGMTININDIWDTSKPSIKDAIVQLGNGCTAEIMSNKGLVFTNHHCGYGAIQKMSTVENNYLKDGFWATSFDEEMPADGLTITFIDDMIDVTDKILNGVTDDLKPSERQSIVDKNIAALKKATPQEEFHSIKIKPFYKGNEYFMIKRITFNDIRLVGTPPASLGKFGGDTDNWMWPRHTADFAVFRVYANQNNEPAEFSEDNIPFTPKYSLKISLADIEEDDFTMVVGFPGRTTQYLTSFAVQHIQDIANPAKVKVRENTLAVMDKHMASDEAVKLKLASKHASLANYWKFWYGESKGLKRFKAVEAKQKFEKEFTKRINADPVLKAKYGHILPRLEELYAEIEPLVAVRSFASEIFGRNIDLPTVVSITKMLIERSEDQGETYFINVKDRFRDHLLTNTLKAFDPETDKDVFAALMDVFVKNVDSKFISKSLSKALENKTASQLANEIYDNTFLTNKENIKTLFENKTVKDFEKALKKDAAFRFFSEQQELIDKKVSTPFNKINTEINHLMKKFMKAQMLVFTEKDYFPDANFTMRVAYGRIKGFEPRDAVYYKAKSHLFGVIEKYIPGDKEFDLPQGLLDLYEAKDYGRYASKDGTLVVNFLATNHITGGNSGSPILNKNGHHIGLAFDGVWEGVMQDVHYRPEVARSIHVSNNFVLFIIDKLYNSQHIMKELTIVED